jgi:hypothetical protein
MGIGGGIFLVALGAILRFAINADIEGVSLDVIGNILMVAGIAVAVFSLLFVTLYRDRGVPRGERVIERRETRDDMHV